MSSLRRLASIAWTLLRHGVVDLLPPSVRVPWALRALGRVVGGPSNTSARGQRLRLALEALGPIFVKFGQVLSTRRDLMPPDIADELAKLQDQVPAFSAEQARATMERAWGRPVAAVLATLNDTPVASASIAQVHFGTLHDGQEVAIKVLRPGMLIAIEQDLAVLHRMAGWLERFNEDGRRLRPREVVAEFDHHLHDELDLLREAANAAQLLRNMEGLQLVMVPRMVWPWCATEVIVMERMKGVPIGQWDRLRAAGVDFKRLAQDGVTIFFTQVFRDGFFHADMHPGNIQVSVEPATLGRYVALDFGIVGTLSDRDKQYLAQNFVAFFRRDYKRVAKLHVESGWVPPGTRVDLLESAVRAVCEPQFQRPLKDISLGLVLLRLFQASRRFDVEIQPQLVLLQKTLLNVEGLGRQLDPDLDLWATAQPFLERWVQDQVGFSALVRHLQAEAPRYAELLPQLPRLLHQALLKEATPGHAVVASPAVAPEPALEARRPRRWLRALGIALALGSAMALGFFLGLMTVAYLWF